MERRLGSLRIYLERGLILERGDRRSAPILSENNQFQLEELRMPVSLDFFVPSKCIDWVCRNRRSVQAPFYCTRSEGHIPGGKTCARTNVSSGITGPLSYLEPPRLWEPPLEDTDHEAELRRQQALSVAVDVPSLLRSAQAYTVESHLSLSSVTNSNSVKADSKNWKGHLCELRCASLAPRVLFGRIPSQRPQATLNDATRS
jgi:hypothetical protein